MNFKRVSIFTFFVLFGAFLGAQEEIEFFDNAFLVFTRYCKGKKFDEERYIQVFQGLPEIYTKYVKSVSGWLQKYKKKRLNIACFDDVREYLDFLREHKLFFQASEFYERMQAKYVYAFDNVQVLESIQKRAHTDYPLVHFLEDWQKDYNTAHVFEDRLHSRYGITKAKNYSLKIELLRIRNNIIFQHEYKHESSSYNKRHWYQAPYRIIRGIGKGIKEFGVYVGRVVTGPSLGS
jgi:hypothetical protein